MISKKMSDSLNTHMNLELFSAHLYLVMSSCANELGLKGAANWFFVQYREEMIEGLEAAPQAFIGLLRGENFGKRVIHVGPAKMIENKESRT